MPAHLVLARCRRGGIRTLGFATLFGNGGPFRGTLDHCTAVRFRVAAVCFHSRAGGGDNRRFLRAYVRIDNGHVRDPIENGTLKVFAGVFGGRDSGIMIGWVKRRFLHGVFAGKVMWWTTLELKWRENGGLYTKAGAGSSPWIWIPPRGDVNRDTWTIDDRCLQLNGFSTRD